ncbi:MAG TPA: PilN domain-containing protein, partial [Ramlibacter sp.]|nr:PilN domain-containing protein [Ramlibacter sp.]
DPLLVTDLLTRVLPDDTSLLGLNIQGSKISITGSTSDAAALMQQLSARPELREVKAPTAATRPLGTSKDSFNIEFTLASAPPPRVAKPAAERPASSMPAASAAMSSSTGAPAAPAPSQWTGIPSPQVPAQAAPQPSAPPAVPQPSAPPAAQSGGASFGGGATFGAPAPAPAKAP